MKIGDKFKIKVEGVFVDFVCSTRAIDHVVLVSDRGTITFDNFDLAEQVSLGRIKQL